MSHQEFGEGLDNDLALEPNLVSKTDTHLITKSDNSFKSVYISTYGCQMNVSDSERMYSLLEMQNYLPVETPEKADLLIINSCSVREKPVHKVYSEVGKFRKLKEQNPNIKIGVGGCVGSQEKDKLIETQPLIDFVFGTDNIDQLPQILSQIDESEINRSKYKLKSNGVGGRSAKFVETQFRHREPYHIETLVRNPGVTAFVNITKGCDNFCTFCVVPYTRGREKSRPLKHVIDDVNKLVKKGVREITVLGQNVNSYKSECGADFADLMERLATDTDAWRIRFTTSHPKDFNEKLVRVLGKHQEKLCEYIHLPFQSGNTRVLEMMNRGYTREEYIEKIKLIKKFVPNVVLSTDIIVGFPSETEAEFQDTISLVLEIGYETIYAFKYSPRPYTKAARFEGQIAEDVKEDRLARLFAAHDEWSKNDAQKYLGRNLEVLVENRDSKRNNWFGRSTQNKSVYFVDDGMSDFTGQRVQVKITRANPAVLHGEISL